jgi:hypothetical protein
VQIVHPGTTPAAQISPAQHLKNRISDMGKPQIGNGIDLLRLHADLEVIFHSVSPYIYYTLYITDFLSKVKLSGFGTDVKNQPKNHCFFVSLDLTFQQMAVRIYEVWCTLPQFFLLG